MDLITIPSAGRAQRQQTLNFLLKTKLTDQYKVALVIPEREARKYEVVRYKGKRLRGRFDVVPVPEAYNGIAKTRQWILTKLAKAYGVKTVAMIDDDLSFCWRPDINKPDMPYINEDADKLSLMYEQMHWWLTKKGFAHVGLISRQANRKTGLKWQQPGRMMNAYAYNVPSIIHLPIEWGRIPVMEDFDLTLQLIHMGHANRISCRFAWTQTSNMEGGCSTYRTSEVQAAAARKLARLHPDVVQVVEREAKTWKGGLTERVDVRVGWQKAWKLRNEIIPF